MLLKELFRNSIVLTRFLSEKARNNVLLPIESWYCKLRFEELAIIRGLAFIVEVDTIRRDLQILQNMFYSNYSIIEWLLIYSAYILPLTYISLSVYMAGYMVGIISSSLFNN